MTEKVASFLSNIEKAKTQEDLGEHVDPIHDNVFVHTFIHSSFICLVRFLTMEERG